MVAFSDAVIAIAITLLVLEIRPPSDTSDLLHGLAALWPSYLAYVLTFMLIGQVIRGYVRRDRRLLSTTIDAAGVTAVSRRFRLALVWLALGTLLGAFVPALGLAVIAAFVPYYWLPMAGELAGVTRRRRRGRRS
ncbi:TMEM175 family protein [Streptomyces sp. NPDC002306]